MHCHADSQDFSDSDDHVSFKAKSILDYQLMCYEEGNNLVESCHVVSDDKLANKFCQSDGSYVMWNQIIKSKTVGLSAQTDQLMLVYRFVSSCVIWSQIIRSKTVCLSAPTNWPTNFVIFSLCQFIRVLIKWSQIIKSKTVSLFAPASWPKIFFVHDNKFYDKFCIRRSSWFTWIKLRKNQFVGTGKLTKTWCDLFR